MNSNSGAIISPLFCATHPIDLAFTTKRGKRGHVTAVDAAGNILFKSKHYSWSGCTQLQDAAGHTLLTMKPKFFTLHARWNAFIGDSSKAKNHVFTIKRSISLLQSNYKWFVYLASNQEEKNCDFKIVGSYRKKNYTIYKGNSSFIVAQFTKDHKLNMHLKHAFGATISTNCDYSFVAALIVIFHVVYVDEKEAAEQTMT